MSSVPLTPISLPVLTRRVRAYFAPVNRIQNAPTIFDPSLSGGFNLDAPPQPWIDLGWIDAFARQSGSKTAALNTGAPATAQYQVRESLAATVSFRFKTWSKLSMALAAGSQHMNILAPASAAAPRGSGAVASPAMSLAAGSTATTLLGVPANTFPVGTMVAVDSDYAGQTGFVGAGISAAYVRAATNVSSDPDYLRRITFNVGRVVQSSSIGLQLARPLIAGAPASGMKVQQVLGFVDREGGSFFQEWSAVFVLPGEQGDRLTFHYPRLQATGNASEISVPLAPPLESIYQAASFRALPVLDPTDSEQVLCFRSYLPGTAANI